MTVVLQQLIGTSNSPH